MEHLLFAGYLILFAWIVTKVNFFTRSGLTPAQLVMIFLVKVMAGIFYGWIGVYYGSMAQMVDTWAYHAEGLQEHQLLLNNPGEFFTSLFRSGYENGYTGFLGAEKSFWNDLHGNFIYKLLALFDLVSFGSYYINVIIYSFLTLFGPMALYRVMKDAFPQNKTAVLLATFFIPSFLYWTSGIHKDGLAFLGIALVTYHLYFSVVHQQFNWRRLAIILLGLLLVMIIRSYLFIVLVPAMAAWVLAQRLKPHPLLLFSAAYCCFALFFFTARYLSPKLDFPGAVADKQQQFLRLQGNSAVPTTELKPTVSSFIVNAPKALTLATIRPYPSDVRHLLSMAAAIEINALLLLFIVFLIWHKRLQSLTPFLLFCIFFSFSFLLTIGYTVNFLGAVVRYRSIVLPFLIVPIAAHINWRKVSEPFLNIK